MNEIASILVIQTNNGCQFCVITSYTFDYTSGCCLDRKYFAFISLLFLIAPDIAWEHFLRYNLSKHSFGTCNLEHKRKNWQSRIIFKLFYCMMCECVSVSIECKHMCSSALPLLAVFVVVLAKCEWHWRWCLATQNDALLARFAQEDCV